MADIIDKVASVRDADAEIVATCLAQHKPVPQDTLRSLRARADLARQKLKALHGTQDIGVAIIREIRGELPRP
jgi:hypothetical protein